MVSAQTYVNKTNNNYDDSDQQKIGSQ